MSGVGLPLGRLTGLKGLALQNPWTHRNLNSEVSSLGSFISGVPLRHQQYVVLMVQQAMAVFDLSFLIHCASSRMTQCHLLTGPKMDRPGSDGTVLQADGQ